MYNFTLSAQILHANTLLIFFSAVDRKMYKLLIHYIQPFPLRISKQWKNRTY